MPAWFGHWGISKVLAIFAGGVVFLSAVQASATGLPQVRLTASNRVPGCVTPARLTAFLSSYNPRLNHRYRNLARLYAVHGGQLGLRWDVGFFQMMIETANLTFLRPDGQHGDVALEDNNFAGLGAVGDGRPGERFKTIELGVRAHLEHVLHYSGVKVNRPVAQRTSKVQAWRTLATWHKGFTRPITFSDLALRWAPHTRAYLASIERLAHIYQDRYCDGRQLLMVRGSAQRPMIAATGWRFEVAAGKAGSAGTIPPSGKPNFSSGRKALGVGRPIATIRSIAPPLPALAAPLPITAARPVAAVRPPVHRAPPARRAVAPPRSVAALQKRPRVAPQKRRKSPVRLSENDRIRQLVSDRKFLLHTQVGSVVPIIFRSNGRMTGQAGGLAFFLGSSRDRGRWWVSKGKLCQKWRIWLDRDVHCIKLTERRGKVWWRSDDGKTGTARIVSR
jgi:hypothetical protein